MIRTLDLFSFYCSQRNEREIQMTNQLVIVLPASHCTTIGHKSFILLPWASLHEFICTDLVGSYWCKIKLRQFDYSLGRMARQGARLLATRLLVVKGSRGCRRRTRKEPSTLHYDVPSNMRPASSGSCNSGFSTSGAFFEALYPASSRSTSTGQLFYMAKKKGNIGLLSLSDLIHVRALASVTRLDQPGSP